VQVLLSDFMRFGWLRSLGLVGFVIAVLAGTSAEASSTITGSEPRASRPPAALRAIPTFHSIGLYWRAQSGSPQREAVVRYREQGSSSWQQGHSLWFDERNLREAPQRSREYRGSIVGLKPGTEYEIEVEVKGEGETGRVSVRTWREEFPVGKSVQLEAKSGETLKIRESGTPTGYVLYEPKPGSRATIDVEGRSDNNIVIDAAYVIVRGLDLKNAASNAIVLGPNAHDVVIEDNDISGWGRIAEDGWGVDEDAAITNGRRASPSMRRFIIQRNRIHHPRSNANNWKQRRANESYHPAGPHAIFLWDTGGNHVIRYNDIYSDPDHYFNDGIGGGRNFGAGGAPGSDSDIYGNSIANCWDDAIESEGGNVNVRIWGNLIDQCYVMIGAASTLVGPLYIFRNVGLRANYTHAHTLNTGIFIKAKAETQKGQVFGGGRVYVYHNTLYRTSPAEGTYAGITSFGTPLMNYVTRNNIFDNTEAAIDDPTKEMSNDFDYDLFAAPVGSDARHQSHGRQAAPEYDLLSGSFALKEGTPGHDDGVVIPNFNDGFKGAGPDRGAQEAGLPPLKFGIPNVFTD